jgi:hypothetical protein
MPQAFKQQETGATCLSKIRHQHPEPTSTVPDTPQGVWFSDFCSRSLSRSASYRQSPESTKAALRTFNLGIGTHGFHEP